MSSGILLALLKAYISKIKKCNFSGSSMSGMTSLVQAAGVIEHKMETVSNNLANVNTVGFKEDQPSFREVLSTVQRIAPESLEERFLSHEYLDDYVGMDKSAVVVDEVGKNFEPGRMRSTGNDLDFALANEGFFTIATPQGERFTRAGNFQLDSTGRVVTNDGFPVLGNNGAITIKEGSVHVNGSGQLSVDGIILDSFHLVRFRNQDKLQKLGQGFFAPINTNDVPITSDEIRIQQGMLEDSNVNSMLEMTRMITATRAYESVHRALSRIDKLDEKAISMVQA
ncbi:MAG: flagellar hook-basal body protein [SAR324 cluster bacterium]|nr:flagellar hook-basal body protein [SAR324 cluster bacterium]